MLADPIPAGFAARKSGLLVKGDLALEATANSQFTWQMKGLDDPTKRGQDSFDYRKERVFREIETSRKRDPLIFRGVDYYDKLGIGIGIELSSDCPETDFLAYAEAVWETNDLDDGQHQASNELVTTANLFTRVPIEFEGEIPVVQLIPSSQIERIATKDGKPSYYRRRWEELVYPEPKRGPQPGRSAITPKIKIMYEDIPAEEMVHTAINRTAGELRGTSMLEPTIYWSALYGRTMETIWATAVARSMIAYHLKIDAANSDEVGKVKTLIEGQLVTRTDPRGQTYQTMATGQMLATGKNVEMEDHAANVSAGSLDSEIRRILLMGAVGMGLPEVFLSDGNTTNRATSQSQSDPYFRMMQSHQQVIIKHLQKVYRKVFDRFMAAGRFVGLAIPEGKTHIVDWLKMSGPRLIDPNIREMGYVALALVNGGVWSKGYACELLQVDWERMKREMTQEKEDGFAPIPQLFPALGSPGSSGLPGGAGQQQLQFSTASLAASVENPQTEDTLAETPTMKAKKVLKKTLAAFLEEAKASKGDEAKIRAAGQVFLRAALGDFKEVIDQTRELGSQSVAA